MKYLFLIFVIYIFFFAGKPMGRHTPNAGRRRPQGNNPGQGRGDLYRKGIQVDGDGRGNNWGSKDGVNVRQDRDGKISIDTSEHDRKSRGYYNG